jgi:hypothetical protein
MLMMMKMKTILVVKTKITKFRISKMNNNRIVELGVKVHYQTIRIEL